VYRSLLTDECLALGIAKINSAFPSLSQGFYKILSERLRTKKVTNEEFADAVNHVIDTCEYPNPNVANFMNYIDKNRVPPEEIKEEIKEGDIIIDPAKEKEIADFNAMLLRGDFLSEEEKNDKFKY
jgi:hypothetical protein